MSVPAATLTPVTVCLTRATVGWCACISQPRFPLMLAPMTTSRERKTNRQWTAAAFGAAMVMGGAGCATYDGPQDYAQSEVRGVANVSYGTVESVRTVRLKEDGAPVGTIGGAAVGGILGSQVGNGAGSAAAAVLGAVGGGIAGNAIEHKITEHDGEEVVVRLDNGSSIAVVQAGSSGVRVGDRVRVLNGMHAHVERI